MSRQREKKHVITSQKQMTTRKMVCRSDFKWHVNGFNWFNKMNIGHVAERNSSFPFLQPASVFGGCVDDAIVHMEITISFRYSKIVSLSISVA